ncbi:MAG: hypothetical protein AAFY75_04165 [Pseudomonadota bacterium]
MSWGPWIKHDGQGCPLRPGVRVRCRFEEMPGEFVVVDGQTGESCAWSWNWSRWLTIAPDGCGFVARIVAYRIWRGQAFQDLAAIAANRRPTGVEGTEHDKRAPEVVE